MLKGRFVPELHFLFLHYDFGKKKPLCYNLGVNPAQGIKGGKPSPLPGGGIFI
jgi:hypothetical protein